MDIYTLSMIGNRVIWAEFGHVFIKKIVLKNTKQDLFFYNGIVPNNFSPDNSIDFLYKGTHIEHAPIIENDQNKILILLHHKYKVFKYLNIKVNFVREKWFKSNYMQDYVYKVKYDEAIDYLQNESKNKKLGHNYFPFVFDHAEIYDIPLKEAAIEIIETHKKVNLIIANSEKVRMIFYRKIINAPNLEELNKIFIEIRSMDRNFRNFQFKSDYIIK